MKIGFVGLGNMATAIIGGLLREGTTFSGEDGDATVITAANIIGSAKTEATRQKRAEPIRHRRHCQQPRSCEAADVLVLAVKPQFFPEVIAEIREVVNENTLVISIAAGLTLERIAALFNRDVTAMRLIRCMAEHPGPRKRRCTAVVPGPGATEADEALCLRLMESFGRAHRHSRAPDGRGQRRSWLLPRVCLHVHRSFGRRGRGRWDAARPSL